MIAVTQCTEPDCTNRHAGRGFCKKHLQQKRRAGVLEHRLVMEQQLGRQLVDGENVHHKNGDKLDNDPENLELWVTHQPVGQRVEDALAWAHEIISRYEGTM